MTKLGIDYGQLIAYMAVMAGVTYLIRMIPFTVLTREITSRYVKSLIYYIPYAVLGAMTFPGIFYSTGSLPSALVGTVCALVLAFFNQSLLVVSLGASGSALLCSLLMTLIG